MKAKAKVKMPKIRKTTKYLEMAASGRTWTMEFEAGSRSRKRNLRLIIGSVLRWQVNPERLGTVDIALQQQVEDLLQAVHDGHQHSQDVTQEVYYTLTDNAKVAYRMLRSLLLTGHTHSDKLCNSVYVRLEPGDGYAMTFRDRLQHAVAQWAGES